MKKLLLSIIVGSSICVSAQDVSDDQLMLSDFLRGEWVCGLTTEYEGEHTEFVLFELEVSDEGTISGTSTTWNKDQSQWVKRSVSGTYSYEGDGENNMIQEGAITDQNCSDCGIQAKSYDLDVRCVDQYDMFYCELIAGWLYQDDSLNDAEMEAPSYWMTADKNTEDEAIFYLYKDGKIIEVD